jgi:signal transduction histidine kinase
MNGPSETVHELREKIIGLGEKSLRKSYYPELQKHIRELEEAYALLERKNAELESYLYVASHDLRSPLVNIQGFSARFGKQIAQIAQELEAMNLDGENNIRRANALELLAEKLPRSVEFILSNTAKMDSLLNGLLRISRTGRIVMSIKELDMNALVAACINTMSYEIEELHARVSVAPLPPCYGDADLVSQVVSNLLGNALKYRSPDRTPNIAISGTHNQRKASYTIQDNGIGIAERHQTRIWDVFYRISDTAAAGEGLGLSIVKRIMDKHRGSVSLVSQEGVGSAFTVTFPAEPFTESL